MWDFGMVRRLYALDGRYPPLPEGSMAALSAEFPDVRRARRALAVLEAAAARDARRVSPRLPPATTDPQKRG
jgi:hypothetical protein